MNAHFGSLVLGLAAQARSALAGDLPPGAVEAGAADGRELARVLIDTLAMLEEKTRGNLGPDETELLRQTITALRIQFATGQNT